MHGVRGAEPQRLLATLLHRVDDDDRLGAGDPRTLDDELAHAARADHERDAARLRTRREQHRADPRQRSAPEQRRVASGTAPPVGSATCEETTTRSAQAPVAVPRYTVSPSSDIPVVPSTSVPLPIARCSGTQAAGRPRAQSAQWPHDGAHESTTSSPDLHRLDRVARVLDDPGSLVPEHHRRRPLPLALHLVEVGAADPDRRHPDDDIVRAGLREIDLDDLERLADCPEEPCPSLHRRLYASRSRAFTAAQVVTVETFWSA